MNDLLKVLDMSEDEQWKWLEKKYGAGAFHSFATLAFRLRDEVCIDPNGIDKYKRVLHLIYRNWLDKQSKKARLIVTFSVWLIAFIDPIDMIIAALKAKGKK